ncbi:hypothetical protein GFM13_20865 [Rhizobium leguminosarum bv. viciae]|nr:hypothetical protein [Rhizobium leguminosarum bv. viciae]
MANRTRPEFIGIGRDDHFDQGLHESLLCSAHIVWLPVNNGGDVADKEAAFPNIADQNDFIAAMIWGDGLISEPDPSLDVQGTGKLMVLTE